jgi:superfamily II RNA helicase
MNVHQHLGYLTSANQLTEVGEWARYIRISPSLLVTELIRTDVLAGMDPPVLAGVMASIAFDDDRPAVFPRISQALAGRLTHVRQLARSLEAYEEPPLLRADVAALPERWIGDPTMRWADLCKGTSMAEGDIYRLLARNLEYLSQIRFLSATHPLLAATSTQAIQIMQREVLEELP